MGRAEGTQHAAAQVVAVHLLCLHRLRRGVGGDLPVLARLEWYVGLDRAQAIVGEMAEANARNAPMARLREATPAQIVANPEMREFALAGGRVAFANNCAACHGAGGQGAVGGFPALVDDDWLWGGTLDAIQATIRHGIRNTEDDQARTSLMPRFGADGMLTAAQISDVAEYVLSLSGHSTDAAAVTRGETVYAENLRRLPCRAWRGQPRGWRAAAAVRPGLAAWRHQAGHHGDGEQPASGCDAGLAGPPRRATINIRPSTCTHWVGASSPRPTG